jgi:hypothetical protein
MSVQLARYLKDFGAPPRARTPMFQSPVFASDEAGAAPEPFAMPPAEQPVDVAAERAEAFAEGRQEAETELSNRHESELTALKEAHRAEIDALKVRYEQDYAAALAERFSGLALDVADAVAAQAAQVLAPVLNDALTKGAVDDLARMVAEGLREGEEFTITVKGPLELFEQLKSRFEEPVPAFKHVEVQDVDLTVEFGDTILVTRMAAWAETVRKVLA